MQNFTTVIQAHTKDEEEKRRHILPMAINTKQSLNQEHTLNHLDQITQAIVIWQIKWKKMVSFPGFSISKLIPIFP